MIEALFYAKINNVGDNCVVHNDETTSHIDVHPRINMVGKRKKGQKARREREKKGYDIQFAYSAANYHRRDTGRRRLARTRKEKRKKRGTRKYKISFFHRPSDFTIS